MVVFGGINLLLAVAGLLLLVVLASSLFQVSHAFLIVGSAPPYGQQQQQAVIVRRRQYYRSYDVAAAAAAAAASNDGADGVALRRASSSTKDDDDDIMTTTKSKSPMFEYLKFDGAKPKFDVVAKTKQYIESQSRLGEQLDESVYDEDYVLRGPVIGPIHRRDLAASQEGLGLRDAFPNIRIDTFGYTIDPENPFRCFYFQRWRSKFENDLDAYGDIFAVPESGGPVDAEMPVSVFSVVWTPDQKIIYEQVGAVVDRFEGNTSGKAAVFGLLHTAGLKLEANPGSLVFATVQRLGHLLGGRGRSWSEDIPKWWTSKSRGADKTD